MKKAIFIFAILLLISGCTTSTKPEENANDVDLKGVQDQSENPLENCLQYYDGCNTCGVVDGKISFCTERYCVDGSDGLAKCTKYKDEVSDEEQEFNDSGRAKAIEDETDLWQHYSSEIGLSFQYPHGIELNKRNNEELNLFVEVTEIGGLEGTMGYDEATALKNKTSLNDGEYGEDVDVPLEESKKLVSIDGVNGQDFMVLGRFDVCDIRFERKLYMLIGDYQIVITLELPKEQVLGAVHGYFMRNEENCGEGIIWNLDKQDSFYIHLTEGSADDVIQTWYDTFDEIIETIKTDIPEIDLSLLIGEWESVDDEKSQIEFTEFEKIDYYDSEKTSEGLFDVLAENKLVVNFDDELFEYSIIKLTDGELQLTYLPRGNTLKYKRAKK